MIAVRAKLDDRKIRRALRRMQRDGQNLDPILRTLRPRLREDLARHARAQEDPGGTPWPVRAPESKERESGKTASGRKRRRRKILGRLPRSITFSVRRGALVATSKVRWSGVQQEGGRVGRGSMLPAREHVGIPPEFAEHATGEILDYIMRGWG